MCENDAAAVSLPPTARWVTLGAGTAPMAESKLLSSLMTALVAGGIAYAVVSGARAPRVDARGARLDLTHVSTKSAEASLDPHTGELTIVSDDRKRRQLGLSAVVDGWTT